VLDDSRFRFSSSVDNMRSKTSKQAEEAARKLREAEKLERRRPVDWSDAALKPLYAQRAREEGERLLAAPEHLVGDASTELVSPRNPDEKGARDYLLATLDEPNIIGVAASEERADVATRAGVLSPARDVAKTVQARNSIEKMLSHQLAAAHHAGMELMAHLGQARTLPPVEWARLVNAAARMFEVFQSGCVTLQKLKTGGRQHVIVQYQQVNVGPGGQTVVAARVRRGSRKGRRARNGR
jgi:hypothetical protein